MKCQYCQKDYGMGIRFCEQCGKMLMNDEVEEEKPTIKQNPSKGNYKAWGLLLAGILLTFGIIFAFSKNNSTKSVKSEEELKYDLENHELYTTENMTISSFQIENRLSDYDRKEDIVYCKVEATTNGKVYDYQQNSDIAMYYSYYDNGGWQLNRVSQTNVETTPIDFPTEEDAISYLKMQENDYGATYENKGSVSDDIKTIDFSITKKKDFSAFKVTEQYEVTATFTAKNEWDFGVNRNNYIDDYELVYSLAGNYDVTRKKSPYTSQRTYESVLSFSIDENENITDLAGGRHCYGDAIATEVTYVGVEMAEGSSYDGRNKKCLVLSYDVNYGDEIEPFIITVFEDGECFIANMEEKLIHLLNNESRFYLGNILLQYDVEVNGGAYSLLECPIVEMQGYSIEEDLVDSRGNVIEKGIQLDMPGSYSTLDRYGKYGMVVYQNVHKYQRLRGMIVPNGECADDYVFNVKIYADEVLIYETGNVGKQAEQIDFDIAINGADKIRICYDASTVFEYHTGILANFELYNP